MKIIIVGNGKVGYAIARQLAVEGHDITMVDSSPVALARADSTLDLMCVEGNGASISVLEEAEGKLRMRAISRAAARSGLMTMSIPISRFSRAASRR